MSRTANGIGANIPVNLTFVFISALSLTGIFLLHLLFSGLQNFITIHPNYKLSDNKQLQAGANGLLLLMLYPGPKSRPKVHNNYAMRTKLMW